jgi:hypothetical protein
MFPPQNGLLSSLPYLLAYICGILAGQMSDFFLTRKIFSIVTVRKLFTTLGKEQPGQTKAWGIFQSPYEEAPTCMLWVSLQGVSVP